MWYSLILNFENITRTTDLWCVYLCGAIHLASHHIQNVTLSCAQCSCDGLQIHHNPEHDKPLTNE